MVMGVSSTAPSKWAFCPLSSSFASSSRFVPFASSKPMKRREVCTIQSAYSTFPCYHDGTSPVQKWYYKLMTDTSPAKMIPCHQDQNSSKGKPFSKEIFNQKKIDKRREQVSRNCSSASVQEVGLNSPQRPHISPTAIFPEKNMHGTPTWDEEIERLQKTKAEVYAQIQEVLDSRRSNSQNHKLLDKSGIQEQADAESGAGNDLNPKNLDASIPALIEPKGTDNNNKGLDSLNHQTPNGSRKKSVYSKGPLDKETRVERLDIYSECLIQEVLDSRQSNSQNHKLLDKSGIQEQADAESGAGNDLNPKNLDASILALIEPKGTDNNYKGLDGVNQQTLNGSRKQSVYSKGPLDKETRVEQLDIRHRLTSIYNNVLVVNNISAAKEVVKMLTHQYRHLVHACDTEVAKIDVKQETPVDHGEVTCFSIYSGPEADFGNGKSCLWIDVLDGGRDLLIEFAPFFGDPSIKKVWHNYSFDNHVIENYGFKVSGFFADTMHMARLLDSSRRTSGGYSLEALTGDQSVMSGARLCYEKGLFGKVSMKTIFGRTKMKKDGSEGKMITIPPVEDLQREERKLWICYSALDAISTLKLYESLKEKLLKMCWKLDGKPVPGKSMFDFYQKYWRPFGEILVKMETEGMLVNRAYLAEIEKVAKAEQEEAVNRFRNWAIKYCPDAKFMNVGSDTQLRQLLFGGTLNSKDLDDCLPDEKIFKVPNTEQVIEEGKKTPSKFRNIKLHSIGVKLPAEKYTATGWPSVGGDALKTLAANISAQYDFVDESNDLLLDDNAGNVVDTMTDEDTEANASTVCKDENNTKPSNASTVSKDENNTKPFDTAKEAKEACNAIASLCEVCSIDSLISNFILPLQGSNVSGKNGRVHCSLNINTETGRLSARRPNLQNQPALEKDRYKIRQAFVAAPGNSLIVADYGQLELRILAHLADCKSMLDAFKAGGDFHSRTAMNMYPHIRNAIETEQVLLEWHPQPGEDKPPVPLLKDAFGSERRKAKMLNFSIAYGKTPVGLARDWKVSVEEAKATVDLWYRERKEVLTWQEARKSEAREHGHVYTLLGRARRFPSFKSITRSQRNHIERAAINTPVQGSAADVAMCAMLEISKNARLKELGWKLLLQVHDEVILEGPSESAEVAKAIVVKCMSEPFEGKNILRVDLSVDAKCAQNWYSAK